MRIDGVLAVVWVYQMRAYIPYSNILLILSFVYPVTGFPLFVD